MMTNIKESKVTQAQHSRPCHDCPWRRAAIPGWLGGATPETFLAQGQGDMPMECHCQKSSEGKQWECVGAAVFRSNICKRPRFAMTQPRDTVTVFASSEEFLKHHALVKPAKNHARPQTQKKPLRIRAGSHLSCPSHRLRPAGD